MSPGFVPLSMEIHGDMARDTPIDDIVLVEQGRRVKGSWNSQKKQKKKRGPIFGAQKRAED